jgi:acetyl esterase/lipase
MRISVGTLLFLFLGSSVAMADEGPKTYALWSDGAPGALGKESGDDFHAGDVPTITVYQAAPDKAMGASVVICPGGGYGFLATEHEGTEVARWLNSLGVTGVMLKYRLGPKYRHPVMLQDAQRAIRGASTRNGSPSSASPREATSLRPPPPTLTSGTPMPATRSTARAAARTWRSCSIP